MKAVSCEEGQALADQYNIPFFEVSSKENINVEEAFTTLANNALHIAKMGIAVASLREDSETPATTVKIEKPKGVSGSSPTTAPSTTEPNPDMKVNRLAAAAN